MPIWPLPPVPEEPRIRLIKWRIFEILPQRTRHFVGLNANDRTGRVSSPIESFDAKALQGTTQSGRFYMLEGRSGHADEAQYVWDRWCQFAGVVEYLDLSKKVSSWDAYDHG
ncbi:hypothetical protein NK8_64290 (plasmid) [Caballeronia sp. NK8]|nr:hypothetical protein NK8_64290 [Caballeronia sp. NK8]